MVRALGGDPSINRLPLHRLSIMGLILLDIRMGLGGRIPTTITELRVVNVQKTQVSVGQQTVVNRIVCMKPQVGAFLYLKSFTRYL